jgi:hypothetical protein
MRTGIDSSEYQHWASAEDHQAPVDYSLAVSHGVDFAICRIGDMGADGGDFVPDPFYEIDMTGYQAAGAAVASYLFLRPSHGVAANVAVLKELSRRGLTFADLEVAEGYSAADIRAFWLAIREQEPMVGLASYPAFIEWAGWTAPEMAPLFMDQWGVSGPSIPCVIWGMTDKASVPGIPALVDLDAFVASDADWLDLFGETKPTPAHPAGSFTGANYPPDPTAGYWLVAESGEVFPYGAAAYHGSPDRKHLNGPVTAIAPTDSGRGYRLFCADGGVFDYGDARFKGSLGAAHELKANIW